MMSGSIEPNARKASLTRLKMRAEAKARPTWAKISIGQRIVGDYIDILRGYNFSKNYSQYWWQADGSRFIVAKFILMIIQMGEDNCYYFKFHASIYIG
jgi:hypothetical protein